MIDPSIACGKMVASRERQSLHKREGSGLAIRSAPEGFLHKRQIELAIVVCIKYSLFEAPISNDK